MLRLEVFSSLVLRRLRQDEGLFSVFLAHNYTLVDILAKLASGQASVLQLWDSTWFQSAQDFFPSWSLIRGRLLNKGLRGSIWSKRKTLDLKAAS